MTSVHKFKNTDVNLYGQVLEDGIEEISEDENDSYSEMSKDYGYDEEDNYSSQKIIKRKRKPE